MTPGLFEPRDRVAAGRTVAVVAVLGAGVTVLYEVVGVLTRNPATTPGTLAVASVIGGLLLGIAMIAGTTPDRVPGWVWAGSAVAGLLVVLWVGVATGDAKASGQIGLVYPVVYAAAHLRTAVAWAVAGLAIAVDAVVVSTRLPAADAIGDLLVVGTAVVMITTVLLLVARHQDDLTGRLSEIAAVDQLTGLSSRRRLEEVAVEVLATPGLPGDFEIGTGLAIIDVDHFKTLNDTYGHPVGDAALVHVAALLRATCPTKGTVARLGGDELAVLLPTCHPPEVGQVCQAFLDAVRSTPLNHLGRVIALSVSVGAAHLPAIKEPDLPSLYAAADEALYSAKVAGRGRAVVP